MSISELVNKHVFGNPVSFGFRYATDRAHSWAVRDWLSDQGHLRIDSSPTKVEVSFVPFTMYDLNRVSMVVAENTPLALSLAALRTCGVKYD